LAFVKYFDDCEQRISEGITMLLFDETTNQTEVVDADVDGQLPSAVARVALYLSEPVAPPLIARKTVGRIWYFYAFLAVALVLYIGLLLVRPAASQWLGLNGWAVFTFGCAVAVLCLARSTVRKSDRIIPLLFGSSLVSWAIGSLLLTSQSHGGAVSASPLTANLFHFAFYVLAYVATMLLVKKELGGTSRTKAMDFVIASFGMALVSGIFVLLGASSVTGGSSLATVTTMTYLVGDFLLLSLIIGGTVILGRRATSQWYLVASAISVIVIGETLSLFQSAHYVSNVDAGLMRVAWLAGIMFLSAALWLRPRKLVA
jgi:hypothetical protein